MVGRLKISDSSLSSSIPQSIVASSLGIDIGSAPNGSVLGFDPLAYFTGNDATLASKSKNTFASSQLLMAIGGSNYSINNYITNQVLESLTTTISHKIALKTLSLVALPKPISFLLIQALIITSLFESIIFIL